MPETRNSKKRQARLSFQPVASSSPQAASLSKDVQARAAAVRYESPTKIRRTVGFSSSPVRIKQWPSEPRRSTRATVRDGHGGLLTPAASSQMPSKPEEKAAHSTSESSGNEFGDTDNSMKGSKRLMGRRTRNHASVPMSESHATKRNTTNIFGKPVTPSKKVADPLVSNSEAPSSRRRLRSQQSLFSPTQQKDKALSTSIGIENPITTGTNATDNEEDEDSDNIRIRSHRKRNGVSRPVILSSDDDEVMEVSSPLRGRGGASILGESPDTTYGWIRSFPHVKSPHFLLGGSTGSAPIGLRRRNTGVPVVSTTKKTKKASEYSSAGRRTSEDVRHDDESEDDIQLPSSRKRKTKATPVSVLSSENESKDGSESESEVEQLPTKARHDLRDEDEDELQDEAEELEENEILESRTRGRGAKNSKNDAKKKQLQILMARREAKRAAEHSPQFRSPNEAGGRSQDLLQDSESESQAEESDVVDDNWQKDEVRKSLRRENRDEYEDDFVVDEDEDSQIEAVLEEMPLEFTMHQHKGVKHHFKYVIEWMVHKKLNPAYQRNDPIYRMAFQKVDDEAKGYAGSKFTSSQWKPEFSRALHARPIFEELTEKKAVLERGCEACGRSNHPATFRVAFRGKAYNPHTLEKLKDEGAETDTSDSDDGQSGDESNDDAQSKDMNGNALISEDHEFLVGRFCKANASTSHSLLHWRWHLNDWVLDYLEAQGYTTPAKIVEREGWSDRKRSKYANKVTDEMENAGEIKKLWRDFKLNMEDARERKVARFGSRGETRR